MNIFTKLFNKEKIVCPRCLGNGNVDWNDIKRLEMELKWIPGSCGYCLGEGKVTSKFASKIGVDLGYLSSELDPKERKKLMAGDEGALRRAAYFDQSTDEFITQIKYLHKDCNLSLEQITAFYLLHEKDADQEQKNELNGHINRILMTINQKPNDFY